MPLPTEWQERVLAAIAAIQPGEIASYGEVAARAGRPRAARSVGAALAQHGDGLPWWRVVRADGSLPAHKQVDQASRLAAEGVEVRGTFVVASNRGPGIRR